MTLIKFKLISVLNKNKFNIIKICIFIIVLILIFYILKYKIKNFFKIKEFFETENIIVPNIIEGLGNQLFIFAAGYAYSKKYKYKLILNDTGDIYSASGKRPNYNKSLFNKIPIAKIDISSMKEIDELEYSKIINNDDIINNISSNNNIYLTKGYYQECKYFNKYRNELLDLFEPTNEILSKIDEILSTNNIDIKNDFLVAIHIRLDDSLTPNNHEKRIYDNDEYNIIIQKLPEHINNNPKTKFLIFSNDMSRTKEFFKQSQVDSSKMIYIHSEDYIELYIMSKCNDYIAAPSTFNWWGIYLNRNPNKKVFIYWKQDTEYRIDFYKKYEYLRDEFIIQNMV